MFLQREYPAAYKTLQEKRPDLIAAGLSGLGAEKTWAETIGGWGTQILDVVSKALPVYQQQKIMSAQLKRAEAGLPPLDISQLEIPGIPIQVKMPEAVEAGIIGGLSAAKLALFAGAGLLIFMLISRK